MNDSNPPKRRWYRFSLRTLLLGLLLLSGCGPSKGERTMDTANEQQAIDAYNRGVVPWVARDRAGRHTNRPSLLPVIMVGQRGTSIEDGQFL